jgi:hypothetical protein
MPERGVERAQIRRRWRQPLVPISVPYAQDEDSPPGLGRSIQGGVIDAVLDSVAKAAWSRSL